MKSLSNINVEFNHSAFKHGVTEDDILKAIDTFRYDGVVINEPDIQDKFLLIGFDMKANLIEVMYNVIDENTINIFHAMKCRRKYIHLAEKRRKAWRK